MASLLLFFVYFSPVVALFSAPIGVALLYGLTILNPQTLWWYGFLDVRPVFYLSLTLILVATGSIVVGRVEIKKVLSPRVVCLVAMLGIMLVSWWVSPYSTDLRFAGTTRDSRFIVENFSKIVLMFFVSSVLLRDGKALSWVFFAYLMAGAYYIFWINSEYYFRGAIGRIAGPVDNNGTGMYADENAFGLLFVSLSAYIWYMGLSRTGLLWRGLSALALIACWHAVFLTASRGAILSLIVVNGMLVWRMKKVVLGAGFLMLFSVAAIFYGGDTMLERMSSVPGYEQDASALGRLEAWGAGISMAVDRPLFGVGPGKFIDAFEHYSANQPRQAHNNFIQTLAEIGVVGLILLCYLLVSLAAELKNRNKAVSVNLSTGLSLVSVVREGSFAALIGLTVGSLFLSMQIDEVLYLVVLFGHVSLNIDNVSKLSR
jgi:putative inorganic carbon (HCO3(-)) transporter